MKKQYGILVDLERCVGCYACEVACKQENKGAPRIRLHTIGPKLVNGKLMMDYVPLISDRCNFCRSRGSQPSCVDHCPTKALAVLNTTAMLDAMRNDRRYQLCNLYQISEQSTPRT